MQTHKEDGYLSQNSMEFTFPSLNEEDYWNVERGDAQIVPYLKQRDRQVFKIWNKQTDTNSV